MKRPRGNNDFRTQTRPLVIRVRTGTTERDRFSEIARGPRKPIHAFGSLDNIIMIGAPPIVLIFFSIAHES